MVEKKIEKLIEETYQNIMQNNKIKAIMNTKEDPIEGLTPERLNFLQKLNLSSPEDLSKYLNGMAFGLIGETPYYENKPYSEEHKAKIANANAILYNLQKIESLKKTNPELYKQELYRLHNEVQKPGVSLLQYKVNATKNP